MEESGISVMSRVSYEPPNLTSSWTMFIPGGYKYSWAASRGWTEGVSSDKRLSLEGLVAAIFLINDMKHEFGLSGGSITMYCLSKGLTRQSQRLKYASVTKALVDNADLLTEFKLQLRIIERTSTVSLQYLDFGDDKNASQQYNRVSLLENVIADHLATLSLPLHPQPYISPPNNAITLYHRGQPLVNRIVTTLRQTMYSDSLQKTICRQQNWTASQFATVDWPAHERAFQHTWHCKRITYSKISNKLLNTNAQNRRFYGKPDLCPCCQNSPETIQHMLTCSSPEVTAFRSRQQDILWRNLALINTPSLVLEAIKLGILSQENSSPEQLPPSSDPLVVEAVHHQTSLGWEAFLRGRISNTWQAAYLGDKDVSVQSLKWAGQVIVLLLHYSQQS